MIGRKNLPVKYVECQGCGYEVRATLEASPERYMVPFMVLVRFARHKITSDLMCRYSGRGQVVRGNRALALFA